MKNIISYFQRKKNEKQNSTGDKSIMEKQTKEQELEKEIEELTKEKFSYINKLAKFGKSCMQEGRTQAISEFKEKLKAEIKEAKGRGKVIIRETDIGEYDKFICTYKLFKIIEKTALKIK